MIYVFRCTECGTLHETEGSAPTDPPPCPCGGTTRRSYKHEVPGAMFKGDGWARKG